MKSIYLEEFEKLNTTADSIYDTDLLIILKDGNNLTSWNDVENKKDILYVSEDLSGFTKLVKHYEGLKSLKAIVAKGVSNRVTKMTSMFKNCTSLKDISTLASWDVSNVRDMDGLFQDCNSLDDISSLANWNVSNVRSISYLFEGCKSLEDVSPLANWDVSNVIDMIYLFNGCKSLNDVSSLEDWNISGIVNMIGAFYDCGSLTDVFIFKKPKWYTDEDGQFSGWR